MADATAGVDAGLALDGGPRPRDAGVDAARDATLDTAAELDAATAVDDAGGCTSPAVTFRLTGSTDGSWVIGSSDNSDTPASNWLTFFLSSGEQLYTSAGETLSLDCRTCSGTFPYGFGSWSSELPVAGVTGTWSGFAFVAGTCGATEAACLTPLCMPAGTYLAKMCGTAPGQSLTCVDVPFEYPTSATVTGMLP